MFPISPQTATMMCVLEELLRLFQLAAYIGINPVYYVP